MIEKKSVALHPHIWRRVLDALEASVPALGENPAMKERLALYEHNEAVAEISKAAKRVRATKENGAAPGELGGEQATLPSENAPKKKRGGALA